jgi:hypothetical protein
MGVGGTALSPVWFLEFAYLFEICDWKIVAFQFFLDDCVNLLKFILPYEYLTLEYEALENHLV